MKHRRSSSSDRLFLRLQLHPSRARRGGHNVPRSSATNSRMEPELVVRASLTDLERGVVLSIPALPDESALTRYNEAAAALTAVARATELPDRYAEAHP